MDEYLERLGLLDEAKQKETKQKTRERFFEYYKTIDPAWDVFVK